MMNMVVGLMQSCVEMVQFSGVPAGIPPDSTSEGPKLPRVTVKHSRPVREDAFAGKTAHSWET